MSDVIQVNVWSDIACPWCYIGKRKFENGAAQFASEHPDTRVEVTYHSFELAPDTPVDYDGSEVDFLVAHKGYPPEQVRQMLDRVTGVAAEVGLDYDFASLKHTKTIQAHQLLHYAKAHGKQIEAKERLLRAYFVEGRHVGRDEELADLAAEIGLDRDDVLRALRANEYLDAVDADIELATRYGIQGVPFFVFDSKYGVSGAQAPETFAQVLAKVEDERVPSA